MTFRRCSVAARCGTHSLSHVRLVGHLIVRCMQWVLPVPISVSRGHFALRYEVPKFLARGGHLCMARTENDSPRMAGTTEELA